MIRLPGNWKLRHIERVCANKHWSSEENMPVVKKRISASILEKPNQYSCIRFTKPSSPHRY